MGFFAQVLACVDGCSVLFGRLLPHARSEPRLERYCDKRDIIARRQERTEHINGEAVQLALFSADAAAQAAVLSKRQVHKAFTKPQAQAKMIESASARPCSRARCLS